MKQILFAVICTFFGGGFHYRDTHAVFVSKGMAEQEKAKWDDVDKENADFKEKILERLKEEDGEEFFDPPLTDKESARFYDNEPVNATIVEFTQGKLPC